MVFCLGGYGSLQPCCLSGNTESVIHRTRSCINVSCPSVGYVHYTVAMFTSFSPSSDVHSRTDEIKYSCILDTDSNYELYSSSLSVLTFIPVWEFHSDKTELRIMQLDSQLLGYVGNLWGSAASVSESQILEYYNQRNCEITDSSESAVMNQWEDKYWIKEIKYGFIIK